MLLGEQVRDWWQRGRDLQPRLPRVFPIGMAPVSELARPHQQCRTHLKKAQKNGIRGRPWCTREQGSAQSLNELMISSITVGGLYPWKPSAPSRATVCAIALFKKWEKFARMPKAFFSSFLLLHLSRDASVCFAPHGACTRPGRPARLGLHGACLLLHRQVQVQSRRDMRRLWARCV